MIFSICNKHASLAAKIGKKENFAFIGLATEKNSTKLFLCYYIFFSCFLQLDLATSYLMHFLLLFQTINRKMKKNKA